MPDVRVEIDPRDVALSSIARLMALEEEVCPVVVARIRTTLALQYEIRVFVGLGLHRLDVRSERRQEGPLGLVVVVAIECGPLLGILERHRALSPYDFGQLDRENVGPGYSKHLGVRRRHMRQALGCGTRRAEGEQSDKK